MADEYTFSIIAYQEGEWWCAQCLEHDVAAQAPSLPDLEYEIERVLLSHFVIAEQLGRQPFEGLGRAPQKFWEAFERATMRVEPEVSHFRDQKPLHPRLKIGRSPLETHEARCQ